MDNVLGTLKGLIRDVTEVGVYLLALGVVAGITGIVETLGTGGMTGLVAAVVVLGLLKGANDA